VIHKRFAKPVR